jgi:dipeptidyl aminopeptidase/acylaminoacyl peptidase
MSHTAVIGLIVAVFVIVLLLPVLRRTKPSRLIGPDLFELQYREVFFKNGALTLSGMLFIPEGNPPFPTVVVIHGSGTSRRNGPWYLTVAKHLQENGIAVLLPDKRGSEKSQGDWTKATFSDLAGDTISAIDFAREQAVFQASSIGVIGFSQGGWIAPVVASRDTRVSFVVTMSGATVTTDEQLLHEVVEDIRDYTYRSVARLVAPIFVNRVRKTEFWQQIGGFDPIPHWRKVGVPVFMAFGEGDKNGPVDDSLSRIEALNKGSITTRVYTKGGHGIVDPVSHRVQEDYLQDLVHFIVTSSGHS